MSYYRHLEATSFSSLCIKLSYAFVQLYPGHLTGIKTGINFVYMIIFLFLTGIEARGFIFGPPIALAIGAKFVPLRKPRKLPGISIILP